MRSALKNGIRGVRVKQVLGSVPLNTCTLVLRQGDLCINIYIRPGRSGQGFMTIKFYLHLHMSWAVIGAGGRRGDKSMAHVC